VTFIDAVAVLSTRWREIPGQLGDSARQRLDVLAADLGRAVSDRDRSRAWHAVVDLMLDQLPATSGIRGDLLNALDVPKLTSGLPDRGLPALPSAGTGRRPSIEDWILATRAYSPAHVLRKGTDPAQSGLIRLRRPDGRVSLPTFQFTPTGEPNPLVLRINQLLGADQDPWGVADWWLCPNVWLSATPAHVIDQVDDQLLVAAAVAATEG
jgi:hypothetical protein